MRLPRNTFRALGTRNFRYFFIGQAVSASGTWMQKIGQAWLVLELTGSGTLLGVTAALQQLPTLVVGPWSGLLADRTDKRRLLIVTQSLSGALALVLGCLLLTDLVEMWMVLVLATLLGTTEALDRPARQAFVSTMVGQEHLTNAVLLNSIVMNSARVVGPSIAGVLIATAGLATTFLVNAASFTAVVLALVLMRVDELLPSTPIARQPGQLREGFRYVRANPELVAPLSLMTVAGLFAYEWTVTLPLLARDAFDGDASTFGIMYTAMGLGAVVGGLAVAGTMQANVKALLRTAWIFSVLMLALSFTPSLTTALLVLLVLGGASITLKSLANALLQLRARPEMRARVLALLSVATGGTTPIGAPLVGWTAETFGVRTAVAIGAVATALATIVTGRYVRRHSTRTSQ